MPCATALQHGSTVYAQSSVRTQQCTLQCTSTRQSSTPSTKSSNVTALSPSPPPGNPHGRGPCSAGVGTVCGVFGARRSSEHLSRESIVSASGCRAVRIYHRASSSRRRQMWKLREKVVVGRVQNDVSGVNLGTPPDVLSQTRVANHFAVAPSVHGHGVPCKQLVPRRSRLHAFQSTTTRRWKWFARGVNLVRKATSSTHPPPTRTAGITQSHVAPEHLLVVVPREQCARAAGRLLRDTALRCSLGSRRDRTW